MKKSVLQKPMKNVIIQIEDFKVDIEVNPEVYSELDRHEIQKIVDAMSKNILIDRSYVSFSGNRWKDSFITLKGWEGIVDIVNETTNLKKPNKKLESVLQDSITIMAITYLYGVLDKYNYSCEDVSITPTLKHKFRTYYINDKRTSWRQ